MLELNKIYCMDAIEGMKLLDDKFADLILTDPPYEVGLANWDEFVEGWFNEAMRLSNQLIFTPGIRNVYEYKKPKWIVCWAKPGSTRRNDTGGFNHWEPLLYYGDKKVMVDFVYLPDCVNHIKGKIAHPCPKPINLFLWLIKNLTQEGDIVLDPFMGSGTTAVACKKLGRKYIGFDKSQKYVELANKRLSEVVSYNKTIETNYDKIF